MMIFYMFIKFRDASQISYFLDRVICYANIILLVAFCFFYIKIVQ